MTGNRTPTPGGIHYPPPQTLAGELRPYPEYKDSGVDWIGQVPKHWGVMPGRACYFEKNESNTGLKEKTVLSLSYGKIVVKPAEKLHGLVPESFETYQIVDPGDIIIRPTDLQNDWNSLRFGISHNRGIITSAYLCFRTKEIIDRNYGHLLLHTYDLNKIFYGLGSGLRQNLDWKDFKYLPCLVPPLNEQAAIVRYHKQSEQQILRLISDKRRFIDLLNEQKQAIISHAVTWGIDPNIRLKPSGIEWLGDVPEHWEIRKISHLFKRIGSGTTPDTSKREYYGGDIKWVNTGDLNDSILTDCQKTVTKKAVEDFSVLYVYPKGSLIIALYGATIGKTCITNFDACTNQACCVLSKSDKEINIKYVMNWFIAFRPQLIGMSYGGGQPNISQNMIRSLHVPIPPIVEQNEIVTNVDEQCKLMELTIERTKREIDLIHEYRTRLISEIITGKVDVRSIEIPEVITDINETEKNTDIDQNDEGLIM